MRGLARNAEWHWTVVSTPFVNSEIFMMIVVARSHENCGTGHVERAYMMICSKQEISLVIYNEHTLRMARDTFNVACSLKAHFGRRPKVYPWKGRFERRPEDVEK